MNAVKMWAPCMPDAGSMEVAADYFAEQGDEKMELLLRMYANNLTEIRGFKFDELQKQFNTPDIHETGYALIKPLGYFYTGLAITQSTLLNNLSLMEQQPIRHLYISYLGVANKDDLQKYLTTYRIGNLKTLSLIFSRRIDHPEQLVSELNGIQLEALTINNLVDHNRRIELAFAMNNRIKKGCVLTINARKIRTKN